MQISFFNVNLYFIQTVVNSTKFQLIISSFFYLMGYDTIIGVLWICKTFLNKQLVLNN